MAMHKCANNRESAQPMKSVTRPSIPKLGEQQRGPSGHIAYLLRQAQASVRHGLDQALAQTGLTSPQFLVLNLLNAYPEATGAELARVAQLTPQTMNLIIRKLELEECLTRSESEVHGRKLGLLMTRYGKLKLAQCKRLADEVETRILAHLDPKTEQIARDWLTAVALEFEGSASGREPRF
jgi:DNA-binding MarR family transcriptional regulator